MSKSLWKLSFGLAAVLVMCAAAVVSGQNTPAPAGRATPVRITAGFKILLELDTPLNSATARVDDEVWFTVRNDVRVDGRIAMPRGTPLRGSVMAVTPAMINGKNQRAQIQIRLEALPLAEGGSHALAAEIFKIEGEKGTGGGAATTVGQATQGAMLGGMISRSAKGAGIGAAVGVGVGVLAEKLRSKGPTADVDLPPGSIFEAKLERTLNISDPSRLAKAVPQPPALPPLNTPPSPTVIDVATADSTPDSNDNSKETRQPAVPELDPIDITDTEVRVPVGNAESAPAAAGAGATLKVDVNLVHVDAMVRDRSGKPMGSLRKEDFRIFEDGVEQQIQFFSRDQLPMAVALVIDRSGSVAPLMGQVQAAAYQALQLLKAGDQVCLFTFAGNVEQLEELTTNRQRVASRIGSIRAGGGTAIVDALSEALRYLNAAAPDKRRAVILISDNIEGNSSATVNYVVQLALETEASIYSVKVGNDAGGLLGLPGVPGIPMPRLPGLGGDDPVRIIVKETGGEIFDATGGTSIGAALTTAVDRLKLRYTISYASSKSGAARSAKGGYHRIEVQLHSRFGRPDANYTVHARSGYYDQQRIAGQ